MPDVTNGAAAMKETVRRITIVHWFPVLSAVIAIERVSCVKLWMLLKVNSTIKDVPMAKTVA